MTEASSGYLSSHSSAASRDSPHLRPTDVPEPRNAKILAPTLTTTSPCQGSSCQAPGLARQYASNSSHVMPGSPDGREPREGQRYASNVTVSPATAPSRQVTCSVPPPPASPPNRTTS